MNRTSIPGFYYDEEKKKFFRIQPGHKLPQGSKYSVQNVHREGRKAKRQKAEDKHEKKVQRQTVKRSSILANAVLGLTGINREQAGLRSSRLLQGQDAALISRFDGSRILMGGEGDMPAEGYGVQLLVADYHAASNKLTCLTAPTMMDECYRLNFLKLKSYDHDQSPEWKLPMISLRMTGSNILYGHTGNTSVVVRESPATEQSRVAVLFEGPLLGLDCSVVRFNLDSSPQALAIQEDESALAVRESGSVSIFDIETGDYLSRLAISPSEVAEDDGRHFCPAIDWLSARILAFGDNYTPGERRILLHDTRAIDSSVQRFTLRDRITGIRVADDLGCRLLVSTNRMITLFDTRMANQPYLQLPHVHEGPELHFATNKLGLVAAVDRDNVIQVYSTWTGLRMGDMKPPKARTHDEQESGRGLIRSVKWYDGGREGSIVLACQGVSVVKWDWHGERMTGEGVSQEDAIPGDLRSV